MNRPDPSSDVLVQVRDLRFGYDATRLIYDGIDLDIRRGRVTAIMGPSGTGKTTMLRLIGGQWRPNSGTVLFDGQNVHKQSQRALYAMRRRMGLLFQHGALLTDLSVFENVAFPLREHTKLPEPMIRDIVLLKLEAVGLRGAHQLYPEQLSGGMARRVALARTIALDPEMVMYDEPFTGQDPINMGVLMRLVRSLNASLGITSVVVSHDVAEVLSISDDVYIVHGGKVIAKGTPAEIRASPSPLVQQFLEGRHDGPIAFQYPAASLAHDLMGAA
ncbi:ABC transporter ATP-binding protein [Sinimarinibacterium sp. NLF-5-8]|uniref:ABC transporter ATP-binding protein n=1 Tax=Sinimarinibacterium sp. NLF-5-8 TaxID=2698684 RepID=UPI00137BDDE4|nr:ABC transporter ATP-binding protein [Sinimarinibacterium sp. NLF-5-8]QHS10524.1 ABC transporter ATP-binding protein [Sinimarinibacterium sp. NLF-5-8]